MLGITLHGGQIAVFNEIFPKDVEPHLWPYRQASITASNRWGKSVEFAIPHIHHAVFKPLLPHEYRSEEWLDARYPIINLCPLVDLSTVVREKVGEILEDRAKEQIERIGGRGHINPIIPAMFLENPRPKGSNRFLQNIDGTEYDGYKTFHGSSMEYRTTADGARAIQGKKFYLVTYDEFTREKDPETLIASDIRPRTLDTRGFIFSGGTPHIGTASTAEDVIASGDPENPDRDPNHISFQRPIDDNPAITQQMKDELVAGTPDYLRPQILEGKFVQSHEAFYAADSITAAMRDIPNQRRRTRGHRYVIAFDLAVAIAGDRCVGVVWDVSKMPCEVVEVVELARGTKHDAVVQEMASILAFYNNERFQCQAILTFDSTGMGGRMFADAMMGLRPRPRPFDFAGTKNKKLSILTSLKIFLDKGKVVYPRTATRLAHELKRYRLNDEKLLTDHVMAMAMASQVAERMSIPNRAKPLVRDSFVY